MPAQALLLGLGMPLKSTLRSSVNPALRSPLEPGVGGAPPEYVGNDLTLDTDLLSLDADTLTLE
jgi:hypothetical protein